MSTSVQSETLLCARNLSVRFGGVLAVNNVSFDVRRGEVFTLIGPNGAGVQPHQPHLHAHHGQH